MSTETAKGDARHQTPLASSAEIEAALSQLASLEGLIDGGNIPSALLDPSAAGPSGSISQGLSAALPALMGPLLPLPRARPGEPVQDGLTALQTTTLLARRAAFAPRNYLAASQDLVMRLQSEGSSTSKAVVLANELLCKQDPEERKRMEKDRILRARKRRRVAEAATVKQDRNIDSHGKARERETRGFKVPDTLSFSRSLPLNKENMLSRLRPSPSLLKGYLSIWRDDLCTRDDSCSKSVTVSLVRWTEIDSAEARATMSVQIEDVGQACITLHFTSLLDRGKDDGTECGVERVTVKAPSEGRLGSENGESISMQSSRFPIYRQLSSIIQSMALTSSPKDKEEAFQNGWENLTATLNALAGLRSMYDSPPPLAQKGNISGNSQIPPSLSHQDQLVILGALKPSEAIGWPVRWAFIGPLSALMMPFDGSSSSNWKSTLDGGNDTNVKKEGIASIEAHKMDKHRAATSLKTANEADEPPMSAISDLFGAELEDEEQRSTISRQAEDKQLEERPRRDRAQEDAAQLGMPSSTTDEDGEKTEMKGEWRAYHPVCAIGP